MGLTLAGTVVLWSLAAGSMMNGNEVKAEVTKVGKQPKNVIFMVIDGTSSSATTLARWYKGSPLALDQLYPEVFVRIQQNQLLRTLHRQLQL